MQPPNTVFSKGWLLVVMVATHTDFLRESREVVRERRERERERGK
jgi:hypothetical protein